jgi:hypothetical protein
MLPSFQNIHHSLDGENVHNEIAKGKENKTATQSKQKTGFLGQLTVDGA